MSMVAMQEFTHTSAIGLIAGSGNLPRQLIESCQRESRTIFVAAVEGETEPATVEGTHHKWVKLAAIGEMLDYFRQSGADNLVLAGKINRPSMSSLRPDKVGAKLLARLGLSLLGGDVAIFKIIVAFLEEQGFRVIGIEDVMNGIIAPEGPLGKIIPDKQSQKDIELGASVLRAVGIFDVGQAVIVKNGLVLGIEAAEGTDDLIERCAKLQPEGKGGVLVKARKTMQEKRVDLPTMGIETLNLMHDCGFSGIAIEAKHSIIVDRPGVIRSADNLGLFVIGFSLQE